MYSINGPGLLRAGAYSNRQLTKANTRHLLGARYLLSRSTIYPSYKTSSRGKTKQQSKNGTTDRETQDTLMTPEESDRPWDDPVSVLAEAEAMKAHGCIDMCMPEQIVASWLLTPMPKGIIGLASRLCGEGPTYSFTQLLLFGL
jgi:hypothetical protein